MNLKMQVQKNNQFVIEEEKENNNSDRSEAEE